MKRSQIQTLTETGESLLKKAELCSKATDVRTFTELGLNCLAEARAIFDQLQLNSVLLFIECRAYLGLSGADYPAYLCFCARNALEILSQGDFEALVNQS